MFEIVVISAITVAIAIAIVLVVAATKPDTFRVQRATTVRALPEKSFRQSTTFINGEPGHHGKIRIPP
jgi:hypothetical protein